MSTSINKLIGTFYDAVSGKAELLDAVITNDWDDIPLGPGQEPGRAGARSVIDGLNKVFGNLRIVVEEIIARRLGPAAGEVAPRPVRGKSKFLNIGPNGPWCPFRGQRLVRGAAG